MTLIIPWGAMVAGRILATILFIVLPNSLAPVANIGSLVSLVGLILFYYVLYQMLNELKNVTKNPAFQWWPIIIPIYNIIFPPHDASSGSDEGQADGGCTGADAKPDSLLVPRAVRARVGLERHRRAFAARLKTSHKRKKARVATCDAGFFLRGLDVTAKPLPIDNVLGEVRDAIARAGACVPRSSARRRKDHARAADVARYRFARRDRSRAASHGRAHGGTTRRGRTRRKNR